MNNELLEYVKVQLRGGIGKDALRHNLMSRGWQNTDIDAVFQAYDRLPPPEEKKVVITSSIGEPVVNSRGSIVYVGFWLRVVASLIDGVLVWVASGFIMGFVSTLFVSSTYASTLAFLPLFIISIPIMLYSSIFESSSKQATIGKMAVGIKVTDLNGGRVSFGQAFGRNICKIFSSIFFIGYIIIPFNAKKQGLHDMLAQTLVVRR